MYLSPSLLDFAVLLFGNPANLTPLSEPTRLEALGGVAREIIACPFSVLSASSVMANSNELLSDGFAARLAAGPGDDCVGLARGGCAQSLEDLYQRCHRYLLLIANQELQGDVLAKLGPSDVVQETLLKAQCHLARFEGDTEAEFRAWLRTILLNCVRDATRRFQAGSKRDLTRERELHAVLSERGDAHHLASLETPSKQVMAAEQAAALRAALSLLPDDYRQVVVLRNIERQSFAAIGQVMNRNADAARKLWLRAVDRLRELLGAPDESR